MAVRYVAASWPFDPTKPTDILEARKTMYVQMLRIGDDDQLKRPQLEGIAA